MWRGGPWDDDDLRAAQRLYPDRIAVLGVGGYGLWIVADEQTADSLLAEGGRRLARATAAGARELAERLQLLGVPDGRVRAITVSELAELLEILTAYLVTWPRHPLVPDPWHPAQDR